MQPNKIILIMEQQQPPVPESRYAPLSFEEYLHLKETLTGIGSHLPTHLMSYTWGLCNRIRKEKTPQPCSCKSSGGLWAGCVNTLRSYVDRFEDVK
jgi:hypothetical protein